MSGWRDQEQPEPLLCTRGHPWFHGLVAGARALPSRAVCPTTVSGQPSRAGAGCPCDSDACGAARLTHLSLSFSFPRRRRCPAALSTLMVWCRAFANR